MLRTRIEPKERKFFGVPAKADPSLAAACRTTLLPRGILPAAFAIARDVLVGAVSGSDPHLRPLLFGGTIFVLLPVLGPIHPAIA